MKAKDIMTANPACGEPDTKLTEVARMLVDHDCGAIPVVEGPQRRPIGVVTDRDIVCRIVAAGTNPADVTAREVMSTPCVTVSPEADFDEISGAMEKNQVRRILVVAEDGACLGVISQADVALKAREKKAGEIVKEVSRPTTSSSAVPA
jgi:CBS domain-containing protein